MRNFDITVEKMANRTTSPNSNFSGVLFAELAQFKESWDILLTIYQPIEFAVLSIGLLGNILALTILALSSKMRTPSFIYHRVLVATDLAFCVNIFLNYINDRWLTVDSAGCRNEESAQFVFRYWFAAFYSGTLYVALRNICGYLIIYVTLIIALDRFLALLFFKRYHYWNHHNVAWAAIGLSLLLSVGLHSWSSFLERSVISYRLHLDEYPLFIEPCWNESIVYQWVIRENVSDAYKKAVTVKNAYNGAVRIAYSILLSLLTIGVFYGLAKRAKRRGRNRSRISSSLLNAHHQHELSAASITATSGVAYLASPAASVRRRSQLKKASSEKMLLLLMIAVVGLAFIHVTAGETKRLVLLLFPPDVILREKVANTNLSLQERLSYFRFTLYGSQISRLVSNFCTMIDRSFICILYMVMNKLFRQEAVKLISRLWRRCSDENSLLPIRRDGARLRESNDLNGDGLTHRVNTPSPINTTGRTSIDSPF